MELRMLCINKKILIILTKFRIKTEKYKICRLWFNKLGKINVMILNKKTNISKIHKCDKRNCLKFTKRYFGQYYLNLNIKLIHVFWNIYLYFTHIEYNLTAIIY